MVRNQNLNSKVNQAMQELKLSPEFGFHPELMAETTKTAKILELEIISKILFSC